MSDTLATWCHQSTASGPMNGALGTSSQGRAPRVASVCR